MLTQPILISFNRHKFFQQDRKQPPLYGCNFSSIPLQTHTHITERVILAYTRDKQYTFLRATLSDQTFSYIFYYRFYYRWQSRMKRKYAHKTLVWPAHRWRSRIADISHDKSNVRECVADMLLGVWNAFYVWICL